MPHSINHGDACLAYFNKIWGIPPPTGGLWLREIKHDTARTAGGAQGHAGVITPLETSPWAAAFAKRLHELGWIEGRNRNRVPLG
jgi:hypothetical protein